MANAADWYAKRLQAPRTPEPALAARLLTAPTSPPYNAAQDYAVPQVDPSLDYAPKGADHLKGTHTGTCPGCYSGNYVETGRWAGQTVMRCYDCGYPVARQAGSEAGAAVTGPPQKALQVSTANNFNPQTIIGRVA